MKDQSNKIYTKSFIKSIYDLRTKKDIFQKEIAPLKRKKLIIGIIRTLFELMGLVFIIMGLPKVLLIIFYWEDYFNWYRLGIYSFVLYVGVALLLIGNLFYKNFHRYTKQLESKIDLIDIIILSSIRDKNKKGFQLLDTLRKKTQTNELIEEQLALIEELKDFDSQLGE